MKILFVGDVYMDRGREAFAKYYPQVKETYKPHITIVNGENITNGNGLSDAIYKEYMMKGVHLFTLGNHAFSRKDALQVLAYDNVVRPANYGPGTIGKGFATIRFNDQRLTVINLLGRVFMRDPIDNPFTRMDELLKEIESDYILVDFHAEATSEKYALANYLDGRVDALIGTHTHVQTADECKFPKGMLYISDVGMSGVRFSIIGGEIKQGIRKFVTGVPERIYPEKEGPLQFNAVLIDLDKRTIQRIDLKDAS
ncbi:MAG: TIGR00282 family metallophosphoesterase [Candidatus Izemoplasmatales bacterium]|jgi:hypothetical protein|nr:TIGR00282 family metallophosphoesterase [Candidatus Izemoplasmatales bacterium]